MNALGKLVELDASGLFDEGHRYAGRDGLPALPSPPEAK